MEASGVVTLVSIVACAVFGVPLRGRASKLAGRDKQHFDCATWLHKARRMPKEEFKQEVEKELTGRETEPRGRLSTSNCTRASAGHCESDRHGCSDAGK